MSTVRPTIHRALSPPPRVFALLISRWTGVPFYCYVHGEELTLARTSKELNLLTAIVLREAAGISANAEFQGHARRDWGLSKAKSASCAPGVD